MAEQRRLACLTPETRGMLGAEQLRRMRRTASLINAARVALADEAALVTAPREGWIAGAAVDAYAKEPPAPDRPRRRLRNCLALPHSAFNSAEVAAATNAALSDSILAVLRGERPAHVVNPAAWDVARALEDVYGTDPRAGRGVLRNGLCRGAGSLHR